MNATSFVFSNDTLMIAFDWFFLYIYNQLKMLISYKKGAFNNEIPLSQKWLIFKKITETAC